MADDQGRPVTHHQAIRWVEADMSATRRLGVWLMIVGFAGLVIFGAPFWKIWLFDLAGILVMVGPAYALGVWYARVVARLLARVPEDFLDAIRRRTRWHYDIGKPAQVRNWVLTGAFYVPLFMAPAVLNDYVLHDNMAIFSWLECAPIAGASLIALSVAWWQRSRGLMQAVTSLDVDRVMQTGGYHWHRVWGWRMKRGVKRMKKAIRFEGVSSIPLEVHDVPYLYDAYGTLDPATVIPVTNDYDGIRVTYHWTFEELGRNEQGERVRRDEWGCLQRVPDDTATAYEIIEKPLVDPAAFANYRFPDPSVSDAFFERTKRLIAEHYPDKFVCGYVDPGPLLVAFNLMSYDGLLMRLHDDLPQVLAVMRGIVDYQKGIIDRWAAAGAHMVSIIDEFAGTEGLMFSPALWREHFAPFYGEIFDHIKSHGLFCGCLFDGDITAIMDDYLALKPDVVEIMQPNLVGIERWGELLRGKVCAKASVDMMTTLATGTPAQCAEEVKHLVRALNTPNGGLIGVSLRWHRPAYPEANVKAVAETFGGYR